MKANSIQTIRSFSLIIKTPDSFSEDLGKIEDLAKQFTKSLGLNIVDKISHVFTPQGITYCAILSESNLSIHTWPEYNTIHIDLVSCKLINDAEIKRFLNGYFGDDTLIRIESMNDFNLV